MGEADRGGVFCAVCLLLVVGVSDTAFGVAFMADLRRGRASRRDGLVYGQERFDPESVCQPVSVSGALVDRVCFVCVHSLDRLGSFVAAGAGWRRRGVQGQGGKRPMAAAFVGDRSLLRGCGADGDLWRICRRTQGRLDLQYVSEDGALLDTSKPLSGRALVCELV